MNKARQAWAIEVLNRLAFRRERSGYAEARDAAELERRRVGRDAGLQLDPSAAPRSKHRIHHFPTTTSFPLILLYASKRRRR